MVIRGEKKSKSHRSVVNHKSYERFYTSIVSHRGRLEVRREQCAAGPPPTTVTGCRATNLHAVSAQVFRLHVPYPLNNAPLDGRVLDS